MTGSRFVGQARAISASYQRSSIVSKEQDQTSTAVSFFIEDAVFLQVYNLFKNLDQYAARINALDPNRSWRFLLFDRPATTPDEKQMESAGHEFKLSHHERDQTGRMKLTFDATYSLVPRYVWNKNAKRSDRKIRWFLNVACNPTNVLLPNGALNQLHAVPHPRQADTLLRDEQGLIVLNTIGYWLLEVIARPLHRVCPGFPLFTWNEVDAARLMAGEPQLLEVSYSLFSQRAPRNEVHELFTALEIAYGHDLYYTKGVTRKFNLGKLLHIDIERDDRRRLDRLDPVRDDGTDTRPVILTKSYADRKLKSRMKFEHFTAGATATDKRALTICTTFSIFGSFFNKMLRAQNPNRSSGATVADLIHFSLRDSSAPAEATAFDRYYAYVADAYGDAAINDYALEELIGLDPADFATRLCDWIDGDQRKLAFITRWTEAPLGDTSTDSEISKQTNIPVRTIKRYREQLRERGLQMKIPFLGLALLAKVRINAGMTPHSNLRMLEAIAQARQNNPRAAMNFLWVMNRAILTDSEKHRRWLGYAPVHSHSLLQPRLLPAVTPSATRFRTLAGE